MDPDQILKGWAYPWYHRSSSYVMVNLCAKFQLSSMIRNMSRNLHPRSPYLEDIDGSWLDGVTFEIMDCHFMLFLTCVPNFSSLAWIEVCQEPPVLEVILGGRWRFLTGDLEDGVILDVLDHLGRPPGTYPESFVKILLYLAEILRCVMFVTKTWQTDRHTHRQTQLKFILDYYYENRV